MEKLEIRRGRKICEAMRGLVEEAQHEIEEQDEKGPIMDLVIVAGMQRIEHYEIAAYGTDIALAGALGEQEIVELLSTILDEEKETDLKLTEVTKQHIMPAAMQEEEGTEQGEEEPSDRQTEGTRKVLTAVTARPRARQTRRCCRARKHRARSRPVRVGDSLWLPGSARPGRRLTCRK